MVFYQNAGPNVVRGINSGAEADADDWWKWQW